MVLVRVLASVFLDIGSGVSLSLQMLLMELPNSRACEDEADRVGKNIYVMHDDFTTPVKATQCAA